MKTLSYQAFKSQTQPQKESVIIQMPDVAEIFSSQEPLTKLTKTIILIPAYNEEKNIGAVLEGIQKESPGLPILVINDGSSDNTEKVVLEHNAEVISLPYNSGYGIALQTGFLYAVKNNFSIVVQMDSDGQHDPANIKDLIEAVQKDNCDVVIGSRFLSKDSYKSSLASPCRNAVIWRHCFFFVRTKSHRPHFGVSSIEGISHSVCRERQLSSRLSRCRLYYFAEPQWI